MEDSLKTKMGEAAEINDRYSSIRNNGISFTQGAIWMYNYITGNREITRIQKLKAYLKQEADIANKKMELSKRNTYLGIIKECEDLEKLEL